MTTFRYTLDQAIHFREYVKRNTTKPDDGIATAVDLFCGAGGLTHGLLQAGVRVTDGYDIDSACRYPYEHNNSPAVFHCRSVAELTGSEIAGHYRQSHRRILVGCAPCVTFSKYTQGRDNAQDPRWSLLEHFGRLIAEVLPDVVSMENVVELQRHDVFHEFITTLAQHDYYFAENESARVVYCPDYGIPQHRSRLVLLASRLGSIQLVRPTHPPSKHRTVSEALRDMPPLGHGEVCPSDPMHRASRLSPLNMRRIQHSIPGGTWNDWPEELIADCHKSEKGQGYFAVYGRMMWDEPSPTITTQFFGFGSGRFGHPEQDRGLSLREGAMLQSFPKSYNFIEPGGKYQMKALGRLIGNAVPVRLGEIIGRSILRHLESHETE